MIGEDGRLYLIIGWAPTRPTLRSDGTIRVPSRWEAVVVTRGSHVEYIDWERVRNCWTIEEWEQLDATG